MPTLLATSTGAAYLASQNPVISPLPANDPIWSSRLFRRANPNGNPATQDVVIKRIPLEKIKPELLQKNGDLALEFCRGVWSGWGKYLTYHELGLFMFLRWKILKDLFNKFMITN